MNENERHAIGHMQYQVAHASSEEPNVCFDYELCETLLNYIERLHQQVSDAKNDALRLHDDKMALFDISLEQKLEIERLQLHSKQMIDHLNVEIETANAQMRNLGKQLADMGRDNERLRAALKCIADDSYKSDNEISNQDVARAAIKLMEGK